MVVVAVQGAPTINVLLPMMQEDMSAGEDDLSGSVLNDSGQLCKLRLS